MVAVAEVIDVLLVDDDALVRSGLSMILQSDSSIRVVGEAADGASGVDAARRLEPDVVLMDIRMPVMDGLAATEMLRTSTGGPAILVLTTFDTDEYLLRALRLGANGFLLKDTPPRDIIEAVKRVQDGESMLSPSAVGTLVSAWREQDRRTAGADDVLDVLTDREREVAIAVAQGLSNAEISGSLFMSVATVKTYVSRVLAKLGCTNRVQIAIAVFESR
ncbi:DNA-binding response regulator [Rhodococcus sp. RS1C4]|uniref:response regulator n=1 Tax=Nocardiaceae TaxID=85025 RepID=UPI00036C91CF|nr:MULTISPECIES: response regulator transcription factor [Rhodococcus]OZC55858.1 DNA-binding response regulator [Rhodococcus sp. 06-621-2]OZC59340.1 DNA-binding response regulator [Rhodococcus sp. RS1C4]OZC92709.1 DNA-binding response regulator [Rhodococcus sp. 06-418-1B]OZD07730.1 DNA-binding response regulator [Rhodococcus sp. 06-156-4C]OZD17057.1 DNA-binding response regulator [Rhodococcus sp. 06-156-3C]